MTHADDSDEKKWKKKYRAACDVSSQMLKRHRRRGGSMPLDLRAENNKELELFKRRGNHWYFPTSRALWRGFRKRWSLPVCRGHWGCRMHLKGRASLSEIPQVLNGRAKIFSRALRQSPTCLFAEKSSVSFIWKLISYGASCNKLRNPLYFQTNYFDLIGWIV